MNGLDSIVSKCEQEIKKNVSNSKCPTKDTTKYLDSKILTDSEDDEYLKKFDFENQKKVSELDNPSSFKNLVDNSFSINCCLKNKPSNNTKFSTCSHRIEGFFKTLIGPLIQSELKWNQDCILGDMKNKNLHLNAYLGNHVLESLIGITCLQAQELFRKYKASKKHHTEDEYYKIFEVKRKECEMKIEKINGIFDLKFDLDRNKFCVISIDNI